VQSVRAAFADNRTLLFDRSCSYVLGAFPSAQTGRRWLLENVGAPRRVIAHAHSEPS
jgi:hypothetical protein